MENNMEIKEEDLIMDIDFQTEPSFPSSDDIAQTNDYSALHSGICKIEIKEEEITPDFVCQKQEFDGAVNSNSAVNIENIGMYIKTEIKEETCWPEITSLEGAYEPDFQMKKETIDLRDEDFLPVEPHRLNLEASSSAQSANPAFFTEYLEETNPLKPRKDYLGYGEGNVCEVYVNDEEIISCIQQNLSLKPRKTHVHKQNENRYSDNGKNIYVCNICDKTFTKRDSWKKHILIHEGIRPFKCEICERRFTQRGHMNRHILIHENEKPYKCNVCEKSFSRRRSLESHTMLHEGKRPFKCNLCNKCFADNCSRQRHILIHEGNKPHKCDICEKQFADKGHLKRHFSTHENKKPYECDTCKKCFSQRASLKTHTMLHEGKRPYKCEICERSYTQQSHLNVHKLIHEGKKPFKCDVCNMSFFQERVLKVHRFVHSDNRPYKCQICDKGFIQKVHLRTHNLRHENKKP